MPNPERVNFVELLPELQMWNDGKGISIDVWLSNYGNYKLAIAFAQLFWPEFTEHDGCILFADHSLKDYAGFLQQSNGDRAAVEAAMNHQHILDLFPLAEKDATEAQIRYLGRMLKEIWGSKLGRDFPNRTFEVHFNDEPDVDLLDYQVTFWQPANRPAE